MSDVDIIPRDAPALILLAAALVLAIVLAAAVLAASLVAERRDRPPAQPEALGTLIESLVGGR